MIITQNKINCYKIKTNSLSVQGQATALNGVKGKSQTVSVSGANHTHTAVNLTNAGNPDGGGDYSSTNRWDRHYVTNSNAKVSEWGWTVSGETAGSTIANWSGNLSMSGTITPSLQSSDTETRPNNFTSIIWKRII